MHDSMLNHLSCFRKKINMVIQIDRFLYSIHNHAKRHKCFLEKLQNIWVCDTIKTKGTSKFNNYCTTIQ